MHRAARPLPQIPIFPFWLALALLLWLPGAGADEILLRDGSRLLGTVVKREGANLSFETTFAGVINIKWDQVAEITTEKPMEFLLSDDTILSGTHVINNVDNLIVEGESGTPPQTLGQDVAGDLAQGQGLQALGPRELRVFKRPRQHRQG